MQIKASKAHPDDHDHIVRTMRFCAKNGELLKGYPYDDPLAGSAGIELVLLVPEGTSKAACEAAIKEGYRQRDVVRHRTVVCPASWFAEAGIVPPSAHGPIVHRDATQLAELRDLASQIDKAWQEAGSIDWTQAEDLVARCKTVPDALQARMPVMREILDHVRENSDWVSGEVGNWPATLSEEIDSVLAGLALEESRPTP